MKKKENKRKKKINFPVFVFKKLIKESKRLEKLVEMNFSYT
jgi:hypothetical protein